MLLTVQLCNERHGRLGTFILFFRSFPQKRELVPSRSLQEKGVSMLELEFASVPEEVNRLESVLE
jgi:hypothetical protein